MRRIGKSKEPTLKQIDNILSNLREKYPERSFCVHSQVWAFGSGSKQTVFKLAILPGFNGDDCQHLECADWPSFLATYKKVMKGDFDE